MGYYTRYETEVLDPESMVSVVQEFQALIALGKQYESLDEDELQVFKEGYVAKLESAAKRFQGLDRGVLQLMFSSDEIKWYSHEEDIKSVSKSYPEFIFQVTGKGEESGDCWRKWFYRGQVQGGKAQIVYPKFDIKVFK